MTALVQGYLVAPGLDVNGLLENSLTWISEPTDWGEEEPPGLDRGPWGRCRLSELTDGWRSHQLHLA